MSEESPTNQSTESSALQTPSSFHVVNASPTQTSTNTIPQSTLDNFWQKTLDEIKNLTNSDFKNQELPLARIKKIMKLDDDVKVMMISAEAPVLFAKAAEIFITELSLRAWVHTEDSKRRTLQRNDIAMAISKCDTFDFLIDIVPREELKPNKKQQQTHGVTTAANSGGNVTGVTLNADATQTSIQQNPVQYYFSLANQQALTTQGAQPATAGQPIQLVQWAPFIVPDS